MQKRSVGLLQKHFLLAPLVVAAVPPSGAGRMLYCREKMRGPNHQPCAAESTCLGLRVYA